MRWILIYSYIIKAVALLSQKILFNSLLMCIWVRLLKGRIEFFGHSHTIGDMCIIDYYLKRKRLQKSKAISVYLVNKPHLPNPYLARFQKRALADSRTIVVMNRFFCLLLAPLERELFFAGPKASLTQHPPEYHYLNQIDNLHLEQKLPVEDREQARELMGKIGLPRHVKFVCVHNRQAGFKPNDDHNSYRNAVIDSYIPAIEYMTQQGLWVIRMGESTVKPLPPMKRVIDYAVSPLKSDFLDIVLIAECEFFVGCNSGFSQVAHVFNKSALWTNSIPIEMCPWDEFTLWIPKLIYSNNEKRFLTFPEIVNRGIAQFHCTSKYVAENLTVHTNSAEDILEATQELHRWYQGDLGYSEEEMRTQQTFNALFPRHCYAYGTRARICASFVRKYRHLMPQNTGCQQSGVDADQQPDSPVESARLSPPIGIEVSDEHIPTLG